MTAITSAEKTSALDDMGADATDDRDAAIPAGAFAGPIVELDMRTLYLRDLSFFGCTCQPDNILPDLIGYIEKKEIRPVVEKEYPLQDLREAQVAFLEKSFVGKIGIIV